MANHSLKARSSEGIYAAYNVDNLALSDKSMIVCWWARFGGTGIHERHFDMQGSNGFGFAVFKIGSNIRIQGPNAYTADWTGGHTYFIDGQWHFFLAELNETQIRLFCDGQQRAQANIAAWTIPTFTSFVVGAYTGGTYIANCDIDEFCVYAGYSTEAERAAAWNGGDGVKPMPADAFANATMRFRAGYDANSATADYAAGTAAPTGPGTYGFRNGFWFGEAYPFATTSLGADELYHATDGERFYAPGADAANPYGYEDWSAEKGVYSDQTGRWRLTAASGALFATAELFSVTFPHYLIIRLRTMDLADGEYIDLILTAPDSRAVGQTRQWRARLYSDKIQGLDAYNEVAVNTEQWVTLRVSAWITSTDNYAPAAWAVVNEAHELRLYANATDPTGLIYPPVLRFSGTSLTGSPYIEVASLAIHAHVQPAVKQSAHDTFPDELHLLATSNAGRQSYDAATEHPFTVMGVIWQAVPDTWSHAGAHALSGMVLDTAGDKLKLWLTGIHNDWALPETPGTYKFCVGYGELPLAEWPDITIADGVGVTQGELVYRPATQYMSAALGGVVDDEKGRRILYVTRYHLPRSNVEGQPRGEVLVGELTDDETFSLLRGGEPIIAACQPPSTADVQVNAQGAAYNAGAPPGMQYVAWGQGYGDLNTWGSGGAYAELRSLFLAFGAMPDALALWPCSAAVLPIWDSAHTADFCVRSDDDFAGVLGSYLILARGRSAILIHPPEKFATFPTIPNYAKIVADTARGVWHLVYKPQGTNTSYAYMRLDGFDWIGIDTGQTTGYVETVTIQKPSSGWGSLKINADADASGQKIEVAVIDPATGEELVGWGQAQCDDVTLDSTDHEVTWLAGTRKLSELTNSTLRLRFHLTRAAAGDATPRLYSYRVADWPGVKVQPQAARSADIWV